MYGSTTDGNSEDTEAPVLSSIYRCPFPMHKRNDQQRSGFCQSGEHHRFSTGYSLFPDGNGQDHDRINLDRLYPEILYRKED